MSKKLLFAGLVGLALILAAFLPSSSQTARQPWPAPRTLLEVPYVNAFAQDGNYIAWVDDSQRCPRMVQLRNLITKVTVSLSRRKGKTCELEKDLGGFSDRMALAGRRALWGYVTVSNSHYQVYLMTAAPGASERLADNFEVYGGFEDTEHKLWPDVQMAGDGRSLVFAELQGEYSSTKTFRVANLIGGYPFSGTDWTNVLDADGSRFAVQRTIYGEPEDYVLPIVGYTVETRAVKDGSIVARFDTDKRAKALAFSGDRIALLTDERIQVRRTDGYLLRSAAVSKNAAPELGMDGRWVVFRTGRTIRALDTRTNRASVLTVAGGRVVGLSIEGRRVAWGEKRGGDRVPDRIRAIVLPR
jgi:hypothetical protein